MIQAERDLLLTIARVLHGMIQDYAGDRRDLVALSRGVEAVRTEQRGRAVPWTSP